MKTRQVLTLGIILGLLVLGIAVKQSRKTSRLASQDYVSLDIALDTSKVAQISIQRGSEAGIQLSKRSGQWKIGDSETRADEARIENFLTEIKNAKGEKRGSGSEVYGDFGIGDDQGLKIKLTEENGAELIALVIGTYQATPRSVFLRRQNLQDVFLAETGLVEAMGLAGASAEPSEESWMAMDFLKIDPEKVNRIEIKEFTSGKETAVRILQNQGIGWKFQDTTLPFDPDPEKVRNFLKASVSYSAMKVLKVEPANAGFAAPNFTLKLGMEDGKDIFLVAGNPETPEAEGYYIQVSGQASTFVLSKFYLENLAAQYERFFPYNPFGIEPEKIEKLVIRADKTETIISPAMDKAPAVTEYLENLKRINIGGFSNQRAKFGKYWIEIQKKGAAPEFWDFADLSVKNRKEYAVQKRGNSRIFSFDVTLFDRTFDLSSLSKTAA